MDRKTVDLLQRHTLYRREPALPEADIQRVMRELGLDYMQARNHVRCRIQLEDAAINVRNRTDAHNGRALR